MATAIMADYAADQPGSGLTWQWTRRTAGRVIFPKIKARGERGPAHDARRASTARLPPETKDDEKEKLAKSQAMRRWP